MDIFRRLRRAASDQRGITGLETAIILISFVVVAAVFAYVTLSSGLFATQKSKEAVNSGLAQAESSMELRGSVVAKSENTGNNGYVSQLTFTVADSIGGESIDFTAPSAGANTGLAAAGSNNTTVISYLDSSQRVEDLYWTATQVGYGNSDSSLDAGEKFLITIGSAVAGAGAGNLVDALNPNLVTGTRFTIEIKTRSGAVLSFQRTVPDSLDAVTNFN